MGVIRRKKINNSSRIKKKQYFIDVGLDRPVLFYGNGYDGKLVTAKFISTYPDLKTIEAQDEDIIPYWGYDIVQLSSLDFILSIIYNSTTNSKIINKNERIFGNKIPSITPENSTIVLTSRYGTSIKNKEQMLRKSITSKEILLIIFGSPKYGLNDLISHNTLSPMSDKFFYLNMFPNQNTETIRLDEAIMGTLSILNTMKAHNTT